MTIQYNEQDQDDFEDERDTRRLFANSWSSKAVADVECGIVEMEEIETQCGGEAERYVTTACACEAGVTLAVGEW